MNKKLLLVGTTMERLGGNMVMLQLGTKLKEFEYDVKFLSPIDGPLKKNYNAADIDTIIEPKYWEKTNFTESFLQNFDLVYITNTRNYSILESCYIAKVPIVWHIGQSDRTWQMENGLREEHFKMANKIVFVSESTKKVYSDLEYNKNFITIKNGVDIKQIDEFKKKINKSDLKKKYGFSINEPIITLVGDVNRVKGQRVFVNAAISLLKNNPALQFLMVGGIEKNPIFRKLESLIKKYESSEKIHLIPSTEKTYDYYLMTDIFVSASYIDSFPNVILEAMAFELPIIATKVGGVLEQIDDDKSGRLIPPGDSLLLAEEILNLLNSRDRLIKYSKNAYEKAKRDFPLETMVNTYERIIQDAIKKGSTRLKSGFTN